MFVHEIQGIKEWGTPVAVVEAEGSGGPDEGNGGSDFVRGKGATETGIRHAGQGQGRVRGRDHRQQGVGSCWEASICWDRDR